MMWSVADKTQKKHVSQLAHWAHALAGHHAHILER
jgi:hypothetical protein